MEFLYEGKKVYYEIHGEGTPLVILNGIMMSTKSWEQFVPAFSADHQLILLDFFDQGQSDKLVDGNYTHEVQVDLVAHLLTELAVGPVNLFGISYGGEIALQFALKYPEHVGRLLLFNTCAQTTYWLEEVGNAWNKASVDAESYYLTTIPVIYSPQFFSNNREWFENRKKLLLPLFGDKAFIDGLVRLTDSSVGYDVKDKLGEITQPTLVVGSEYDFVTPLYQQEEIAECIPNAHLVKIPNSGHASMYEQPELFQTLVLGFAQ